MNAGSRRILEDLRRARVLVVHPRDEDGAVLIQHLKRLGCEVQAVWPLPPVLPADWDTVFVQVEDTPIDQLIGLVEAHNPAIIAILTYESPTALRAIIDINAHGVISKPLRPLGILTQFALARYRHGYEKRMTAKVQKLEETLKGRRLVDRAVHILVELNRTDEDGAYRLLREQATSRRVAITAAAEAIIGAYETMSGLGLTVSPSPRKG